MTDYDKGLINSRITEVCDYYLPGEGRREGQKRRIWECPECGRDSFSANDERGYAGCFAPSCDMPKATDSLGIIARFEDFELRSEGFVQCLHKGYEILGIPIPDEQPRKRPRRYSPGGDGAKVSSPRASANSDSYNSTAERGEPGNVATATASTTATRVADSESALEEQATTAALNHEEHEEERKEEHTERRQLVHRVYRAFLEFCPLAERDRQFWHSRGVNDKTIQRGGFGSIWRERCYEILPELGRRFGNEAVISVPGFYLSTKGRLQTNLYGDYTLIPYHDRDGYITTVEGRVPGQPEEGKPKYVAPVNSGLHLYVYPGYRPEQVMAFCEGAVGAIVAAQSGIPVAAIKGFQSYRTYKGKGEGFIPLPELAGVAFGRRRLLYIVDEDVKEKTRDKVIAEAPQAARTLIEDHGGTPLIVRLPGGYKDLDEWLLAVDEVERVPEFAGLMPRALTPEQWEGTASLPDQEDEEDPQQDQRDQQNSTGPTANYKGLCEANGSPQGSPTEAPQGEEEQSAVKGSGELRRTVGAVVGESKGAAENEPRASQSGASESGNSGASGKAEDAAATQSLQAHQVSKETSKVRTRPRQPRAYKPIPKTNFGEFMVAGIYALFVGIACLSVLTYAAPQWGPTSSVAALPAWASVVLSAIFAIAVLAVVCRQLYIRRWRALRSHLAGHQA